MIVEKPLTLTDVTDIRKALETAIAELDIAKRLDLPLPELMRRVEGCKMPRPIEHDGSIFFTSADMATWRENLEQLLYESFTPEDRARLFG